MEHRQIPPDLPRTLPRRNVQIVDIRADPEGVLLVLFFMGELGDPILVSCRLHSIAVLPAEPEPEP